MKESMPMNIASPVPLSPNRRQHARPTARWLALVMLSLTVLYPQTAVPQPSDLTIKSEEAAFRAEGKSIKTERRHTVPKGAANPRKPFQLLGQNVKPGSIERLSWAPFSGITEATPVVVVRGVRPGPTLCLTAAVHGDEINGIQIVQRIIHSLEPDKLSGNVIGVPIVNLQGFRQNSRYLWDRRDLNRYFPGHPQGSAAARIAYSFFHEIVMQCDALVDIHTASLQHTNLTQLRANALKPAVKRLTQGFGPIVVLHSKGIRGTLRRAADAAGVPAVTLELGEAHRIEPAKVEQGYRGIQSLMAALEMVAEKKPAAEAALFFHRSKWVRANDGGFFLSRVSLGETVRAGQLLGIVTDPISEERSEILSSHDGRVLGMAINQVIMPGYAVFRIGMQTHKSVKNPLAVGGRKER
ncbi:MAG: succinylglutamate desuccinylase/aspartoacylase family protein [Chromatiales bacterium]